MVGGLPCVEHNYISGDVLKVFPCAIISKNIAEMKTISEREFERFLTDNNLQFEKIKEQSCRTPDYSVRFDTSKVFFEVKELLEDENFKTESLQVSHRIVGDHIRNKITSARGQVQFGARQGIPSVLLVYNNLDPIHLFGTEDLDFITAMYGEYTLNLDLQSGNVLDSFHGKNRSLGTAKNTSFSALGRLYPVRARLAVTLFENAFAKLKLPFDSLPSCFEVKRVELT